MLRSSERRHAKITAIFQFTKNLVRTATRIVRTDFPISLVLTGLTRGGRAHATPTCLILLDLGI